MKVVILAAYPVHLLPGFDDSAPRGHYATWLPQICDSFAKENEFEFHWVVVSKMVSKAKEVVYKNQIFHLIPRISLKFSAMSLYLIERVKIKKTIKKISPQFIHAWGTEDVYGFALKGIKHRSLLSMQGVLSAIIKAGGGNDFVRRQAKMEKLALRCCDEVSCESDWAISKVKELSPDAKLCLIEYGIGDNFFEIKRTITANPSCLFVGSLCRMKGVDLLLKAFQDPRLKNISLILIGAGELGYKGKVVAPNIHFMGRLKPSEVAGEMRKSWALIHPTHVDSSPNCVKEARVIGLPVLTTINGGQTQYVEHEKSGYIFEIDDLEGLVESVLSVTQSKEHSLEMGSYDQNRCRQDLNSKKTAQILINKYNEFRTRE